MKAKITRNCKLSSLLKNKAISSNLSLIKQQNKSFALYIPKKELIFFEHPYYGKVCPIYIADKNDISITKKTTISSFSYLVLGINSYFLLTNLGLIKLHSSFQAVLMSSNITVTIVFFLTAFWLKNYFAYMNKNKERVKNMYLLPDGTRLIIEKFNDQFTLIDNLDIYEQNIYNVKLQETRKEKYYDDNHNSFSSYLKYGKNRDLYFQGKYLYLDYELFNYICNRYNIDTKQVSYNKEKEEEPYSASYVKENRPLAEKINKMNRFYFITLFDLRKYYYRYKRNLNNNRERMIKWLY